MLNVSGLYMIMSLYMFTLVLLLGGQFRVDFAKMRLQELAHYTKVN